MPVRVETRGRSRALQALYAWDVRQDDSALERIAGLALQQRQAARRLTGHVVEVRRVAPHHGAHRDGRRVAVRLQHARHRHGQFPRAGHPQHVDVV